jgi:hypothetical protein
MDKKIKNLIDQNVFNSNLLDYDIEERTLFGDDNELYITIYVDHFKLWKSSGRFNLKYYQLIVALDEGYFEESLMEFLPIIGYTFEDIRLIYNPIVGLNSGMYSAYDRLFKALNELVYYYERSFNRYSPWLTIEIESIKFNLEDLRGTLEDEFNIDTDDIVMLDA